MLLKLSDPFQRASPCQPVPVCSVEERRGRRPRGSKKPPIMAQCPSSLWHPSKSAPLPSHPFPRAEGPASLFRNSPPPRTHTLLSPCKWDLAGKGHRDDFPTTLLTSVLLRKAWHLRSPSLFCRALDGFQDFKSQFMPPFFC